MSVFTGFCDAGSERFIFSCSSYAVKFILRVFGKLSLSHPSALCSIHLIFKAMCRGWNISYLLPWCWIWSLLVPIYISCLTVAHCGQRQEMVWMQFLETVLFCVKTPHIWCTSFLAIDTVIHTTSVKLCSSAWKLNKSEKVPHILTCLTSWCFTWQIFDVQHILLSPNMLRPLECYSK